MSKIKVMNEKLANMIAAGEVVDKPASVIKELVENSLDANATIIKIEVFNLGLSRITVTDNGEGMDKDDANHAFFRHATSKIFSETDLTRINTLGFRGEALAAISSVSKVTLKTKEENKDGYEVVYHGGRKLSEGITSMNKGTSITVEDLFYNTPARFKYLKSESAERNSIIDIFDRLALANPKVRLSLFIDDKLVKETFGTNDYHSLLAQIYGQQVIKDLTLFSDEFQKIKISGLLVSPSITRSRRKDISIFVNGRYIKNYNLIQAVISGYHSYIMVGRYPIAIINLDMDPNLLDVNVHPQKLEVKFVNESLLSYHLENFIKDALNKTPHEIPMPIRSENNFVQEQFVQETLNLEHFIEEKANEIEENNNGRIKLPYLEYIGVLAGTYLLFQNDDSLYMMDQHAAAERIRYEYYYEKMSNPNNTIQTMLIKYPLKLTDMDFKILSEHKIDLEKIGFIFDEKSLIGHPIWLRPLEIDIAIETITAQLEETNMINIIKLRDSLAKDISCKGAIKANKALNKQEIDALVQNLRLCDNPYTCPHGRPTLIRLSHYDIEKMFKRVV